MKIHNKHNTECKSCENKPIKCMSCGLGLIHNQISGYFHEPIYMSGELTPRYQDIPTIDYRCDKCSYEESESPEGTNVIKYED